MHWVPRWWSDQVVLRAIAVERALHSVIFGLFTLGLVLSRHDQREVVRRAAELKDNTSRDAGLDWFTDRMTELVDLRTTTVSALMITSMILCLSEGVQAVGLWRDKRWAEYFAALTTASFLPFELSRLIEQVTILRVATLVLNLAILFYLVWIRRLFGLRGGGAEPFTETRGDPARSRAR